MLEEKKEERILKGKVMNCVKLNVRKKPDIEGNVKCIINNNDIVRIYEDKSTDEWYRVNTKDGVYGYCMKKYISILP